MSTTVSSGTLLQKHQYMGVLLIDALEFSHLSGLEILLRKHRVNPNLIVDAKGFAAVHYVSGMPNKEFAKTAAKLIFEEFGGDPNLKTPTAALTPMHIAAGNGYEEIFELLLRKGGDPEFVDNDGMSAISYAIEYKHNGIIEIAKRFLKTQREERKRVENAYFLSPGVQSLRELRSPGCEPNLDASSPYYIYITHRKKTSASRRQLDLSEDKENLQATTPKKRVNVYDLTEANLHEYSKYLTERSFSNESFIKSWSENVYSSRSRESLTGNLDVMEQFLSGFCSTLSTTDDGDELGMAREVKQEKFESSDYLTADESAFLHRSPQPTADKILQMMEVYQCRDLENNIKFKEMKLKPIVNMYENKKNDSCPDGAETEILESTISTAMQIPSDYETDALREELTVLGDRPGPITKTTKRLYIKRLIQYKKNPEMSAEQQKNNQDPPFSVELRANLQMEALSRNVGDFVRLEQEMLSHFSQPGKNWREGSHKTSFVYLLIDPRVSKNLPASITTMKRDEAWKQFLKSIFYVGKGKSSRPYAHLYDAIRHFEDFYLRRPGKEVPGNTSISKKLRRIMDIWDSEYGVVCLHVFHNILPVEAYTREAAIIECLGLQNLTNLKRGDFYGPGDWTMRNKKHLGVLLLYKAMQIHLAEGETQLQPIDLL